MDSHEVTKSLKAFLATTPADDNAILTALASVLIEVCSRVFIDARGAPLSVVVQRDLLLATLDYLIESKTVAETEHKIKIMLMSPFPQKPNQ